MDFLYSLVAVVLLCARLEAISTQTNVDTEEPTIIRSPALGTDRDDGFGWTAVLHQMEEVMSTDSLSEALRKTRYIYVYNQLDKLCISRDVGESGVYLRLL